MHTHVFYVFMAYPIFLFFGYISRVRGSSWVFSICHKYQKYFPIYLLKTHIYIGEGSGTPLQYSCLENPMDGGAWWAAVHGVAKSQTWLSDFTSTFHFHALEKEMATHSSVLAWRIPGTGEPGGLPSMRSHRVRHDWSDLAAAAHIYRPMLFKSGLFKVSYTWTLG